MLIRKIYLRLFVASLLLLGFLFISPAYGSAEGAAAEPVNERAEVLSSFLAEEQGSLVESFNERREQHKILFYMGVLLLVFVLLTAGFGVSMAMLGKEVFVPHMICAGVTVFLSIAHAVVAVVWFFPF